MEKLTVTSSLINPIKHNILDTQEDIHPTPKPYPVRKGAADRDTSTLVNYLPDPARLPPMHRPVEI